MTDIPSFMANATVDLHLAKLHKRTGRKEEAKAKAARPKVNVTKLAFTKPPQSEESNSTLKMHTITTIEKNIHTYTPLAFSKSPQSQKHTCTTLYN